MKKTGIIVSAIIIMLAIGAFWFWSKEPKHPQPIRPASAELSPDEYEQAKERFTNIVNVSDPATALSQLDTQIKTDDALLRSCHALTHDLGHVAYLKYQDFAKALTYQNEICNSGYMHGVIESFFDASPDVFVAMTQACAQYPTGKFLSWECYHGVGHGLMYYTSNDLPKSIEMCGSFGTEFARTNCSNGVFMENFNSDEKIHPSKYLKSDDLFYPCTEQTGTNQLNCYLYSPTHFLALHPNDYSGALKWCESAAAFQTTCAEGVGMQLIKENINQPKFAEATCLSNKQSQNDPCMRGVVGLYINHFGSLDPARDLCDQLEAKNKSQCQEVVQSYQQYF